MSWKLAAISLALVFRNLGVALRVSVGPVLLGIGAGWLVFSLFGVTPAMVAVAIDTNLVDPGVAFALLIALAALVIAAAWVAVGWHRFILLDEVPGLLPNLAPRRVAIYAWRSGVLSLLVVLLMFPVSAIGMQVLALTGLMRIDLMRDAFSFAVGAFMTFLWLRLALGLPAAALDRVHSVSKSWNDSARLSSEILGAGAVIAALDLVFSSILDLLPLGLVPGLVVRGVLAWVVAMAGGALLSLVYAHLVEGRRLT
ncbi:MAG: hypothetical protein IT542_03735 [Rubellimicrobium sp.]|nr:hypothetical protein [Rubellimicrobium sp.]